MPKLENFLISATKDSKPFPMPQSPHSFAVLGGALSSLALAYELGRKGHRVTLFSLQDPEKILPPLPQGVAREAIAQLKGLRVGFETRDVFDAPFLQSLISSPQETISAVFLGFDDVGLNPVALGLSPEDMVPSPLTGASRRERLFIGGLSSPTPYISALSQAKKVALSIERLIQGVDMASARENEAAQLSKLPVDLSGQAHRPPIVPQIPGHYSQEEARAEASRCLDCGCLACLPPCAFLSRYKSYPRKSAREYYNNIITAFGNRFSNSQINSCAECGLCAEICPNRADLGEFVDKCRRYMVASSHMPASAHEFALEDQEFSNSPLSSFVRCQKGSSRNAYLFFPGCQMVASYPQATKNAYLFLSSHLSGGVSLCSACCGAPGAWSGRERLTQRTKEGLIRAFSQAGSPEIILACPSCQRFFRRELPEAKTIGLYEILDRLPLPPEALSGPKTEITLHDPCASRLDPKGQAAVRSMASRLSLSIREPRFSGRLTLCCGYGGLAAQANPELGREYVLYRLRDSPGPILSWCSVCRDRFREEGHESLHILDFLFPQGSFERMASRPAPGLSERRWNRHNFKKTALLEIWGEEWPEEEDMSLERVKLILPDGLLEELEKRRILVSDLEDALGYAEKNGPAFISQDGRRAIVAYRPRQVTFWVEYEKRADGEYLVNKAWCHRMAMPNVPGESADSPATLEGYAADGGRV
jgi:Fe-S oxidoreductase